MDTSAVIAILRREPESAAYAELLEGAECRRISAVNYVEAAAVIDARKNPVDSRWFDTFLREGDFIIEPVSVEQARVAREAYRDFGKGSGHPAQLNPGDCFAYALAKELGEALLFKGSGFSRTDIASVRD
ncbi:MAG TPA: type II toxin-antitoxin system VapC family toxin [Acidobacteriaceae bacterium]